MSRDAVEQMVGRAVVDRAFCSLLLTSPADAAGEYDLSEFERRLLTELRAHDLADFAGQLEARLRTPPLGHRPREFTLGRKRRASA